MLGGAMKNLAIRAGLAILGVVVMIAWWTIRGDKSDTTSKTESRIPAKVWEGGATLTIELETSEAARMYVSFGGEDRSLEAREQIQAGRHSWTIDVPPTASAYVTVSAEDPKVGAKLSWTVTVNGRVIDQQSEELTAPLQPGYAFGLGLELEDIVNPSEAPKE